MNKDESLYSPEPRVNREIVLVVLAAIAASAVIAVVMSYAP